MGNFVTDLMSSSWQLGLGPRSKFLTPVGPITQTCRWVQFLLGWAGMGWDMTVNENVESGGTPKSLYYICMSFSFCKVKRHMTLIFTFVKGS